MAGSQRCDSVLESDAHVPKGGPQGLCWGPGGVSLSPAVCLCLWELCQHLQGLCQFPKHCARPQGRGVLVSPRGCQHPQGLCQCCQEECQLPKGCARSPAGRWCPGVRCVAMVSPVLTHTRVCSSVPVSPGLCQVLDQAVSGQ